MILKFLDNYNFNVVMIFVINEKLDMRKKITKIIKDKHAIISVPNLKFYETENRVLNYFKKSGYEIDKISVNYIVDNALNNYDIEFKNVTITLGDKVILKDLNFKINENEKVLIFGKTGSGKTILFKTLIGFYDYSGSITIGGVEIKEMNRKNIREYVCMILQDSYIYSKTIRDNIKVLDQYIPDNFMIDLSKEFMLHDDIINLKEGYNTMLGSHGIKLSKGQNQRLILTRSFVKPKNIMIFDDSFSAIDNKNKKAILKDLLNRKDNFTKIIVTYDILNAPLFDKVLYINNGKVKVGTHNTLINSDKTYKKIYDIASDKVGDSYE